MPLAIDKMDGCGHINTAHCETYQRKLRHMVLASYKMTTQKMEHFIYKSEWVKVW